MSKLIVAGCLIVAGLMVQPLMAQSPCCDGGCNTGCNSCCPSCGCQDCCGCCKLVCEMKKIKKVEYKCKCDTICIPHETCHNQIERCGCEPNCPGHCNCDSCLSKYLSGFFCHDCNGAPCADAIVQHKLVKCEYTCTVPVYKWVHQSCCSQCGNVNECGCGNGCGNGCGSACGNPGGCSQGCCEGAPAAEAPAPAPISTPTPASPITFVVPQTNNIPVSYYTTDRQPAPETPVRLKLR